MDPVGNQKKISGGEMNVRRQKLIDGGGKNKGRQFNHESGTRTSKFSTSWQGTTKGKTKHTYKAD